MRLRKGHLDGRLDDDDLGGLLRAGARHDARRRPTTWARRSRTTRCGGSAGWSPCTRSAASRWAARRRGRVRRHGRGVRLPRPARPRRLGDAGAGRRQPVPDDRGLRRPRVRPDDGHPAASVRRPRGGHHVARADRNRRASPGRTTDATNLSFTEEMKGFVALDVDDPVRGAELGRQLDQRLMFHLTITAEDVDRFVVDPAAPRDGDRLRRVRPVRRPPGGRSAPGSTCSPRTATATRRKMLYRLHFADAGGNPLTLVGHKDVHDDPGVDVWQDTSTLYTRILAGHVAAGRGRRDRRRRRRHHHPRARLPASAHDVPHRGTGPGARDGGVRPALPRPALGGLRTVVGGEPGMTEQRAPEPECGRAGPRGSLDDLRVPAPPGHPLVRPAHAAA